MLGRLVKGLLGRTIEVKPPDGAPRLDEQTGEELDEDAEQATLQDVAS